MAPIFGFQPPPIQGKASDFGQMPQAQPMEALQQVAAMLANLLGLSLPGLNFQPQAGMGPQYMRQAAQQAPGLAAPLGLMGYQRLGANNTELVDALRGMVKYQQGKPSTVPRLPTQEYMTLKEAVEANYAPFTGSRMSPDEFERAMTLIRRLPLSMQREAITDYQNVGTFGPKIADLLDISLGSSPAIRPTSPLLQQYNNMLRVFFESQGR